MYQISPTYFASYFCWISVYLLLDWNKLPKDYWYLKHFLSYLNTCKFDQYVVQFFSGSLYRHYKRKTAFTSIYIDMGRWLLLLMLFIAFSLICCSCLQISLLCRIPYMLSVFLCWKVHHVWAVYYNGQSKHFSL
jgi:hypothetical protein